MLYILSERWEAEAEREYEEGAQDKHAQPSKLDVHILNLQYKIA